MISTIVSQCKCNSSQDLLLVERYTKRYEMMNKTHARVIEKVNAKYEINRGKSIKKELERYHRTLYKAIKKYDNYEQGKIKAESINNFLEKAGFY